jgi:hypothetical protein
MPLKFTHQAMKIINHSALYVFAQEWKKLCCGVFHPVAFA